MKINASEINTTGVGFLEPVEQSHIRHSNMIDACNMASGYKPIEINTSVYPYEWKLRDGGEWKNLTRKELDWVGIKGIAWGEADKL
jgi:hypothetical protein